MVVEEISSGGRRVKVSWFGPPFRPEPPDANQAYGICFTEDGLIVLVCSDDDSGASYWNLPGGGVEPGETLEGCLEREVAEEACAHVLANRYIGCQRVDDPDPPDGAMRFYQTRFWARVELLPWEPRHETNGRRLVRPEHFLRELTWGSAPTALNSSWPQGPRSRPNSSPDAVSARSRPGVENNVFDVATPLYWISVVDQPKLGRLGAPIALARSLGAQKVSVIPRRREPIWASRPHRRSHCRRA